MKASFSLYLRLLQYITQYKGTIALTVIALIVLAALEPAQAAIFQKLIDESLLEQDPDSFVVVPLMLSIVYLFKGAADYSSKVASQWIAQRAILEIRADMFTKIHQLPLSTHQQYGTGKMMSKITYDVPMASNALANAWIILIRDSLTVIALISYLIYLSWQLTLFLGVVVPIVAFIIDRSSKLMRKASKAMQSNMGDLTQQLEEGIRGFKDIKVYNAEAYESKLFRKTANKLLKNTMKVTQVSALNVPLLQVLAALALSGIIYVAIQMSVDGYFTPGELIAYVIAMGMTFEPIRRLTSTNETLQKGLAAAESIFEFIDHEEEHDQGKVILTKRPLDIRFDDVSFSYPNTKKPAIDQFNLRIDANKTTALVGYSGSGKTSLVNLIARFYVASQGSIAIDGIPIEELSLSSLRQQIAFVSQSIILFNDTIAANIAYGHDEHDIEAIKEAAIHAHAWEFIEALPEGLDTVIGDNGANLSGGQRQRLSLARAFLKDAPILILDEATSALDNQSENMVQSALEELSHNRTVIIIAHRLTSIQHADTIVVMDSGRVLEQGSHQALMEKQGHYYELYTSADIITT